MTARSTTSVQTALGLLSALCLALPAAADPAASSPSGTPPAHPHTASHHHTGHKAHQGQGQQLALTPRPATLPTPPPPPRVGPAPTPNDGVTPPVENPDPKTDLQPSVFSLHYPPQGDGYTSGSSPQALDDRNANRVTGVQLTVPLKQ